MLLSSFFSHPLIQITCNSCCSVAFSLRGKSTEIQRYIRLSRVWKSLPFAEMAVVFGLVFFSVALFYSILRCAAMMRYCFYFMFIFHVRAVFSVNRSVLFLLRAGIFHDHVMCLFQLAFVSSRLSLLSLKKIRICIVLLSRMLFLSMVSLLIL